MSAAPLPTWCTWTKPITVVRRRCPLRETKAKACSPLSQPAVVTWELSGVIHGTTVATNTLLEQRCQNRHHHHTRLPRRVGNAPARSPTDLGLMGTVRTHRASQPPFGSNRASSPTVLLSGRSTWTRWRPRLGICWRWERKPSQFFHQRLCE